MQRSPLSYIISLLLFTTFVMSFVYSQDTMDVVYLKSGVKIMCNVLKRDWGEPILIQLQSKETMTIAWDDIKEIHIFKVEQKLPNPFDQNQSETPFADTNASPSLHRFEMNANIGLGLLGIIYDVGFYYQSDKILYGLRYLGSCEISAGFLDTYSPYESIWEVDALVGTSAEHSYFIGTIMSGLSVIGGTLRGKLIASEGIMLFGEYISHNRYESLDKVTIGIPIQAQLAFVPVNYGGIALSYFANVNTKKIYNGFIFTMQVIIR